MAAVPNTQTIGTVVGDNGAQIAAGTFYGNVTFSGPQADTRTARLSECLNLLYVTDPTIDRQGLLSVKGKRASGTCEWVRKSTKYQSWRNDHSSSIFWIHGSPGKGKTVISIYLTQDLEKEESTVLYFFCVNGDATRNNANAIVRTMIWQSCTLRPDLTEKLLLYLEATNDTKTTVRSNEALWSLFLSLLNDSNGDPIVLILDGLDECDEESQNWIAMKLIDLCSFDHDRRQKLKIIIISRYLHCLRGVPTQLRLDHECDESIKADIERFVSSGVLGLSGLAGFDTNFQTSIEAELLARCEGTYLWVGVALTDLLKKKTCVEVVNTLRSLPAGLFPLYARMLDKIEPAYEERCSLILKFLATAVRILHVDEFADAVGIEASGQLSSEQQLRDYLTLCGPMIRISDDGCVSLLHQSAREFLLQDVDARRGKLLFRAEKAHLDVARRCLVRLEECFDESSGFFTNGVGSDDKYIWDNYRRSMDSGDRFGAPIDVPPPNFNRYAFTHWPVHVRAASALAEVLLDHKFFTSGPSKLRYEWWGFKSCNDNDERFMEDEVPPAIHIASSLGILPWMCKLLKQRDFKYAFKSPAKITIMGVDALCYACEAGHLDAARLLLDSGADVNCVKGAASSLWLAMLHGSEALIRLLLSRGADPIGAPPRAAVLGREALVRLFLDEGADPASMLLGAVEGEHESLFRLLTNPPWNVDPDISTSKEFEIYSLVDDGEIQAARRLQRKGNSDTKQSSWRRSLGLSWRSALFDSDSVQSSDSNQDTS